MRRLLTFLSCALALSACQMTVGFSTEVLPKGDGVFTLAMGLDADALKQIRSSDASLAGLEGIFSSLRGNGWNVQRDENAQGLAIVASRKFTDAVDYARGIAQVRQGFTSLLGPTLGGMKLDFGLSTSTSVLKDTTRFRAELDTSGGPAMPPAVRAALQQAAGVVTLDVRATLPGGVGVVTGDGTLIDQQVVWRPRLGTAVKFGAVGSSTRVVPLLALVVPAIAILAALIFFAAGKRRRRPEDEPELLAIKPDEPLT